MRAYEAREIQQKFKKQVRITQEEHWFKSIENSASLGLSSINLIGTDQEFQERLRIDGFDVKDIGNFAVRVSW